MLPLSSPALLASLASSFVSASTSPPTAVTIGCKDAGGCWDPSDNHGSVIVRVVGRQGGKPRHQREGDRTLGRRGMGGGLVGGGVVFGRLNKYSTVFGRSHLMLDLWSLLWFVTKIHNLEEL